MSDTLKQGLMSFSPGKWAHPIGGAIGMGWSRFWRDWGFNHPIGRAICWGRVALKIIQPLGFGASKGWFGIAVL